MPDYRVVTLEGRDAAKFAQAQFMSDVAALADGHWHWSGWLTPKGRTVALFALLKLDEARLWLLLDADPAAFIAQLQRFVFRSKVALRQADELRTAAAFATPALADGAALGGTPELGIELDLGAAGGARVLRLSTAASPPDRLGPGRWAEFDLAHGLPHLPPGQAGQWTPQQLSLDRLRAYSVKKGCYPGQEIVARTHFLGQAKRGLVRLRTGQEAVAGESIRAGDREAGTLICGQGREALAVLPLPLPEAPLTVAGVPCSPQDLYGGLER